MVFVVAPFAMGTEIADSLADGPKQLVVGMSLEAPFVGEGEHLVVDTRRIADAQDIDATIDKFFGDPVNGHIALCADKHLVLASKCLINGLDEGGGLASTWGTVDDGHILRLQDLIDGLLLGTVQISEVHRREAEGLCRLMRIKQISQITEPSFCPHHTVKGLKHHLITRLIEEQLDAHVLCPLHIDKLAVVRHSDHHPVAIDIADGACEIEVADGISGFPGCPRSSKIYAEKTDRSPEFEVMLYLVITLTEHLYHQLIERVIVALAHLQGVPGITTLHLPHQSHLLGLFAESILLGGILHLEQKPLLLECLYRCSHAAKVTIIRHELHELHEN